MIEMILRIVFIALVLFIVSFVAYWIGRSKTDKESFQWKTKYEDKHRDYVMLKQRENTLQAELERVYPNISWEVLPGKPLSVTAEAFGLARSQPPQ